MASPFGHRLVLAIVLGNSNGHRYNEFKANARHFAVEEQDIATHLAMQYDKGKVASLSGGATNDQKVTVGNAISCQLSEGYSPIGHLVTL